MGRQRWFDRFADRTERVVSSAAFFFACVLLVLLWAPSILLPGLKLDTWQLIINTLTTIITFLLVALLTNTQHRFEDRTDAKLTEILKRLEEDRNATRTEASRRQGEA